LRATSIVVGVHLSEQGDDAQRGRFVLEHASQFDESVVEPVQVVRTTVRDVGEL